MNTHTTAPYPDIYYYDCFDMMIRISANTFVSFDINGDRAIVRDNEGSVFHVKLLDSYWLFHHDSDYAFKTDNLYTFYFHGVNSSISDFPCDDETRLFLTLKYSESKQINYSISWYEI